jgi:hypothetical protein
MKRAIVTALGLLGITTSTMAASLAPSATNRSAVAARTAFPPYNLPPYGGHLSTYDGPIYNPEGQWIGTYRGPVLGYSTSCNILTPAGYLYTCQAFTW